MDGVTTFVTSIPAAANPGKIAYIETDGRKRAERRQELEWVRAAQSGSDEAAEALFRRHWGPAYRAAYLVVRDGHAAEDIVQEAFLSALRALDRFDRRRPFAPWLHRIVVNRAIDWSRARALRREVGEAAEPDMTRQGTSRNAYSDDMVAALAALPEDQRAVVVLRHVLGYTPGEIAKLLGFPRGTVNSRLRRALDRLAAELEEEAS
jgi:RNA polymerase sigma-70 factor (ECF subfamily)